MEQQNACLHKIAGKGAEGGSNQEFGSGVHAAAWNVILPPSEGIREHLHAESLLHMQWQT